MIILLPLVFLVLFHHLLIETVGNLLMLYLLQMYDERLPVLLGLSIDVSGVHVVPVRPSSVINLRQGSHRIHRFILWLPSCAGGDWETEAG